MDFPEFEQMNSKLLGTVALLAGLSAGSMALAEGTAEAGQAKSATCVACHGTDGNSANPEWPSIAGQHAGYISGQLELFRSGTRQNVLMSPMAMALSDQDIADLAAYYSSQTLKGGETEPSKLALGKRIYLGGNATKGVPACIAYHGPRGHGNPQARYPNIGGQHAVYVAAALRAYRSGDRASDPNQMMRNAAAQLTDDEIDALASYVQGLR